MNASSDAGGYLLTPADGPHLWFLDTRMSVKAGVAQTGGGFTLIEWSAPPRLRPAPASARPRGRGVLPPGRKHHGGLR